MSEALEAQLQVARFYGAKTMVPVTQAHVTIDFEVMGQPGLEVLRRLAGEGARVAVPTTRNSRSVCPALVAQLGQRAELANAEAEVSQLLEAIRVRTSNTCVPYEGEYVPAHGERVAWGDTGACAYANGVLGARTNFEGGIAGLWAALTGRTPRYGFHVAERRLATAIVRVNTQLASATDWAVLGALVGQRLRGYETVPLIDPGSNLPGHEELKGFAASVASYGSIAMFHVLGVTPEAMTRAQAVGGNKALPETTIGRADLEAFYARPGDFDLVVFTAPQLSEAAVQAVAAQLGDRRFKQGIPVLITTSPGAKRTLATTSIARLEEAGATVIDGTCWYLMEPARMRERFGWRRVLTDSPKLANIIPASGYVAVVRPTDVCVEAAVSGQLGG